jgi:hypothetical protein
MRRAFDQPQLEALVRMRDSFLVYEASEMYFKSHENARTVHENARSATGKPHG